MRYFDEMLIVIAVVLVGFFVGVITYTLTLENVVRKLDQVGYLDLNCEDSWSEMDKIQKEYCEIVEE